MRIAICTDQYPPQLGGVPDVVRSQLDGLLSLGHEVMVFAPSLPGYTSDRHVVRMPTRIFARGMGNIVFPFGFRKRLQDFKPDVVHVHSVGVLVVFAGRAARDLNIPFVITYHGSMADYLHMIGLDYAPIRSLVVWMCARYFNTADVLTAPSRRSLDQLKNEGVVRPRFEYVANPIDTSLFRPQDKTAAKRARGIQEEAIMLFGRLSREKNMDDAIAVFRTISAERSSQLVLIGDGPDRKRLESMLRDWNLEKRCVFLGRLTGVELVEAINACDVMLTTSLAEVQPLTVLQALACGVPVVGADAGGVPECIRNGEDGYIVQPHDIDGYGRALTRILSDDALRRRMSESARSRASQYSPAAIAKAYENVYRSLSRADIAVRTSERSTKKYVREEI